MLRMLVNLMGQLDCAKGTQQLIKHDFWECLEDMSGRDERLNG